MKRFLPFLLPCLAALMLPPAMAQMAVDISIPGVKVRTGNGNSPSAAANTAGSIDSSVEIEGVAVINGDVFIDGEKVPRGRTSHRGRKSGKTYQIKWGGDGNVAVQEK